MPPTPHGTDTQCIFSYFVCQLRTMSISAASATREMFKNSNDHSFGCLLAEDKTCTKVHPGQPLLCDQVGRLIRLMGAFYCCCCFVFAVCGHSLPRHLEAKVASSSGPWATSLQLSKSEVGMGHREMECKHSEGGRQIFEKIHHPLQKKHVKGRLARIAGPLLQMEWVALQANNISTCTRARVDTS